jgi:hypothetical protein
MEILKDQSDPSLDHLDRSSARSGKLRRHLTHEQAVNHFLHYFPKGVSDPEYLGTERQYKVDAHELWCKEVDAKSFSKLLAQRKYSEIVRRALQVEGGTNLLSMFEKAALREAVRAPDDAEAFATGLYDLIYGSETFEMQFERFRVVLNGLPQPKARLRWTAQTIFPFLALPEEHIFLKPKVTLAAAVPTVRLPRPHAGVAVRSLMGRGPKLHICPASILKKQAPCDVARSGILG